MWIFLLMFWTALFTLFCIDKVHENDYQTAFGGLILCLLIDASILVSKFW